MLVKLEKMSPRPFWLNDSVSVMYGSCSFDYSSPSTHVYQGVFFYPYIIYIYLYKYSEKPSKLLIGIFATINLISVSVNFYFQMFDGQLYLHQNILSTIESLVFLFIMIELDISIMSFV